MNINAKSIKGQFRTMKKIYVFENQQVSVSFRKNTYGVWQYDAFIHNQRFRKSTKSTIFEDAERVLQAELSNIVKKATPKQHRIMSLEDIWDSFINTPGSSNPGNNRLKIYQQQFNDFLSYMQSNYPDLTFAHEVTEQVAKNYIQYIRTQGRFNKSNIYCRGKHKVSSGQHVKRLSAATKNEYLNTNKMIFNMVADEAGIVVNPFARIPKLRSDKVPREIYLLEELKTLEESQIAQQSYLYPLIMVAPYTGLREGDICTLLHSEVDLNKRWINRIQLKTKQLVRIPIMPKLYDFLIKQPNNSKHVFPELCKIYLSDNAKIGGDFTELLGKHGIESNKKVPGRDRLVSVKDVHSFRHTFVYLAAINNIPLPVVQSIVGHMSPEMTKMYMDHATDDIKQKYFNQLSMTLGQESKDDTLLKIKRVLESGSSNARQKILELIK